MAARLWQDECTSLLPVHLSFVKTANQANQPLGCNAEWCCCLQAPTFFREGLYTGGYLGVTPVVLELLKGHPALEGYPAQTPLIIAGVTGGLLAVTTTQPLDTVKTRMQANVVPKETPEYTSSLSTMRHVINQGGGIGALWSGIAPRAFRIVGATFILNATRTYIVDKVEASRTKQ